MDYSCASMELSVMETLHMHKLRNISQQTTFVFAVVNQQLMPLALMLRLQYVNFPVPKATLLKTIYCCLFLFAGFFCGCCCCFKDRVSPRRPSWPQIIAILLLQHPKFLDFWLEIQNVWLKLLLNKYICRTNC